MDDTPVMALTACPRLACVSSLDFIVMYKYM